MPKGKFLVVLFFYMQVILYIYIYLEIQEQFQNEVYGFFMPQAHAKAVSALVVL